ncbi:hypothetical protein BSZ19_04065 [Bradyrhizobium japonicum]|uniref:Peptidase M41 domain-containing protein n=1 Tax=Bradyrhizobium japonicum TaxID=375 RepID=A0A1Y2JWJ7_BRAJP|nr:hypothetical protein [Bradyrhizobium japonicum]OSJ36484.1 hypothetical protein BSZ19_04065 [Bradyrhizobium japonicum]
MTKELSADERDFLQPALAEVQAAAGKPHSEANGSGLEEEINEYDELLAALGRTPEQDRRIAIHEAGHAVCARLLGHDVGGITANPDAARGYEGLCWGVGHAEAFAEGRGDASDVRDALAQQMPHAGDDRRPLGDVFANVYAKCIEFVAGRAAERMVLDGEPAVPADDLRQARELALLICKTEEAIETFLAHCDVAARDLLMPYGDVVMTLSIVLRIKRTLDGTEIDEIIRGLEAEKALAAEHRRRAEWKQSELAAGWFRAQCELLDAARRSSSAQDWRR